ncbi:MAG: acetyl-CoA decarbonylase/synthase complex subunit delta [Chloroflexi bacterium]|nr:acetyl-CoA decarbonylase/synthase complex subunit delta [Chloroflexota bacterium]MDA8188508.1 acetyl-CoA decarbonylase/synthase complex subunit delta [Dehalococcoidales bacterium]
MPVTVETPIEKWNGKVREVTLGATQAEGGTRTSTVTVGGSATLPFLHFEGSVPHRPVIAIQIQDVDPQDWSPALRAAWGDTTKDVVAWAKKAAELGPDLIALNLRSAHPDAGNRGADEVAQTVKSVLGAVGLPLIVYGPGVAEKDNDVLVRVAEVTAGERLAIGLCEQGNYRTIVAACLANGHIAIARAPIDVNIQKQINILINDMGLPLDRILMDPTTGALGYGLEYSYSVLERLRLSSLQGDGMTQMPTICTVGEEAWRAKESKVSEGVPEAWGNYAERGVIWETITATTQLQAGADIVVLRHPKAVGLIRKTIDLMMAQ